MSEAVRFEDAEVRRAGRVVWTDVSVGIGQGYVTVTPLQFDLTHYPQLREWKQRAWAIDPASQPT